MTRADTGLVHSVQARIVIHAKRLGVEASLVFSRYALERFLYRLSKSAYAEQFVLKGAMLMLAWAGETVRATRDADLLSFGLLTGDEIARILREIMSIESDPDDGVVFLPETLAVNPIREGEQYGGERVTFEGRLGKVKLSLQVDVGTGDAVYPPAEWMEYPSLLNAPRPMVRGRLLRRRSG